MHQPQKPCMTSEVWVRTLIGTHMTRGWMIRSYVEVTA
jgi:hypothetical protein